MHLDEIKGSGTPFGSGFNTGRDDGDTERLFWMNGAGAGDGYGDGTGSGYGVGAGIISEYVPLEMMI